MTIYDIAREAGVSASMVSRVINNKPGVAAEKRKKIQKLLEENHYVPNEMARSLVTSSTRMVGILVTDIRHEDQLAGANYITRELRTYGFTYAAARIRTEWKVCTIWPDTMCMQRY